MYCKLNQDLISDTPVIAIDEVKRFMSDCALAVGVPQSHAKALADLLAEADYRGHYSHGMNRLGRLPTWVV